MVDENSLRDTMNQLVALQAQQLNAMNTIVQQNTQNKNTVTTAGIPSNPQFNAYANYAPNYMPPETPFSPSTNRMKNQYSSYADRLNANMGFNDMIFANKSKISTQNRQLMGADFASNASNVALSGAGVIAGGATDLAVGAMMPGLLSSIAFGGIAGLAVGSLFQIGIDQNQQTQAYNKYLLQNSYRFINSAESNNKRDIDGFNFNERYQAADFLRKFNTSARISDSDTMTLLQKYTEGGMLKEVRDLETFQKKMSQLTQVVKTSALLLNETLEDVSQLMSDMEKAGISSKNFDYLSAKARVGGSMTGLSASEFMRTANSITEGITPGTSYSNLNTNMRAGDTMIYMNKIYDTAKANQTDPVQAQLYNIMTNMGGFQGASNVVMQAQNAFTNTDVAKLMGAAFSDYSNGALTIDQDAFTKFLSSNASLSDLSQQAQQNINSWGPGGIMAWRNNMGTTLGNNLSNEQMMKFMSKVLNLEAGASNISDKNYTNLLSIFNQDMGPEVQNVLGSYLNYFGTDQGNLSRQAQAFSLQKQMIETVNANRAGAGYTVVNAWEGFKDAIGDASSSIGQGFNALGQNLSDWWMGTKYSNADFIKGRSWDSQTLKDEGRDAVKTLLEGVKQGLQEAKQSGYEIKQQTIQYFSDAAASTSSSASNQALVGNSLFKTGVAQRWSDIFSKYDTPVVGSLTNSNPGKFDNENDQDWYAKNIAEQLGIKWDDTPQSVGALENAITSKYDEYLKMMNGYVDKTSTDWETKYTTADRLSIMKQMEIMSGFSSKYYGVTLAGMPNGIGLLPQDEQTIQQYRKANGLAEPDTSTKYYIGGGLPANASATTVDARAAADKYLRDAIDKGVLYNYNGVNIGSNWNVDKALEEITKQKSNINDQGKDMIRSTEHRELMGEIEKAVFSTDSTLNDEMKNLARKAAGEGDLEPFVSALYDKNIKQNDLTQRITKEGMKFSSEWNGMKNLSDLEKALKVVQSRAYDFEALGSSIISEFAPGQIGEFTTKFSKSTLSSKSIGELYDSLDSGKAYLQSTIEKTIMDNVGSQTFLRDFKASLESQLGSVGSSSKYIQEIQRVWNSSNSEEKLDSTLFKELVEKLLNKLDAQNTTDPLAGTDPVSGKTADQLFIENNNSIAVGIETLRKVAAQNQTNVQNLQNDIKNSWISFMF